MYNGLARLGIIAGLILVTFVSVYAATYFPSSSTTYNNSATGMNATNVQTAIDELYNTCFPPTGGNSILNSVPIVTSGDGLYKDEYEEGRYFYKGKNPSNYIKFNNELWRIISLESDGTMKIMKPSRIILSSWDAFDSNNWAKPAGLNTYLNETYYKSLSSTSQSQIVAKDFSIGSVTLNNNDLSGQINDENSKKWNGKVALVTVSEYLRSNSDKNNCNTISKINANSSCANTTWMIQNDDWWTLTAVNDVYIIYAYSIRYDNTIINKNVNMVECVRPTVYLSSKIKITGGNGSSSSPYQISL